MTDMIIIGIVWIRSLLVEVVCERGACIRQGPDVALLCIFNQPSQRRSVVYPRDTDFANRNITLSHRYMRQE